MFVVFILSPGFLKFQLRQIVGHYSWTLVSEARLRLPQKQTPHSRRFCHALTYPTESNATTGDVKYLQLCPAFLKKKKKSLLWIYSSSLYSPKFSFDSVDAPYPLPPARCILSAHKDPSFHLYHKHDRNTQQDTETHGQGSGLFPHASPAFSASAC